MNRCERYTLDMALIICVGSTWQREGGLFNVRRMIPYCDQKVLLVESHSLLIKRGLVQGPMQTLGLGYPVGTFLLLYLLLSSSSALLIRSSHSWQQLSLLHQYVTQTPAMTSSWVIIYIKMNKIVFGLQNLIPTLCVVWVRSWRDTEPGSKYLIWSQQFSLMRNRVHLNPPDAKCGLTWYHTALHKVPILST